MIEPTLMHRGIRNLKDINDDSHEWLYIGRQHSTAMKQIHIRTHYAKSTRNTNGHTREL